VVNLNRQHMVNLNRHRVVSLTGIYRRQGERSEIKHLLLCAVLKVTEWKTCSERVRRNVWNEVTGSTGALFENLDGAGKGKCND